jgi:hypothetical protein
MSNLPRLDALLRRGGEPAAEEPPADPTALAAAVQGLLLAGAGPDWWPYAVLVSPGIVAVYVAGAHCPQPVRPWEQGHEARLWIGARDEVRRTAEAERIGVDTSSGGKGPRPVLLGMYEGGFVYVDAARAPGPLLIAGAEPWAGRVRELLDAQLPSGAVLPAGAASTPAAYWPIQVDASHTISLLGTAMARVVRYPERMAPSMAPRRALPGSGSSTQAPQLALVSGPAPTAAVSAFGPAATAALAAATAPKPAPAGAARQQPAHAAPRKPSPPQVPRHPVPPRRSAPPAPPVIDFEAPAVSARAAESGGGAGRTTSSAPSPFPSWPAAPPPSASAARTTAPPPPVYWDDVAVSSAEGTRPQPAE